MPDSSKRLGLMFTLVGPGGVGKNTLINMVVKNMAGLRQLPTATTRPMRPTEQQGREHHFVSLEEFQQMIEDNKLLEWQEVHKGSFYGIPRATIEDAIQTGKDMIADIENYGASILKNTYPDNVILIFVAPPSLDDLETRLRDRGASEEEISNRLQRAQIEMPFAPGCDYLLINDDFETAAQALRSIVTAERSRSALLNLRVAQDQPRHPLFYTASVLATHESQVLIDDSTHSLPCTRLLPGEFPHEAARRLLQDSLADQSLPDGIINEAQAGCTFVAPDAVVCDQDDFRDKMAFVYRCNLTPETPLTAEWRWIPADQVDLSPTVQHMLAVSRPVTQV